MDNYSMFDQPSPINRDKNENGNYAMALHLCLFLPYINWLVILILWFARKDKSPLVRQHGAVIINLFLSITIYIFLFLAIVYFLKITNPLPFNCGESAIVNHSISLIKGSDIFTCNFPLTNLGNNLSLI